MLILTVLAVALLAVAALIVAVLYGLRQRTTPRRTRLPP